jgi:hypothetical protein
MVKRSMGIIREKTQMLQGKNTWWWTRFKIYLTFKDAIATRDQRLEMHLR